MSTHYWGSEKEKKDSDLAVVLVLRRIPKRYSPHTLTYRFIGELLLHGVISMTYLFACIYCCLLEKTKAAVAYLGVGKQLPFAGRANELKELLYIVSSNI